MSKSSYWNCLKNTVKTDLDFLWEDIKNAPADFLQRHTIIIVLAFLLIATVISLISSRGYIFEHCALFFSVVSVGIVYCQVRLQATFTKLQPFTSSVSTAKCINKCVALIDKTPEKINIHDIEHNEHDDELYASVTFILGLCDDVAAAVRENIISDRIVRKTQGQFIMKIYRGLKPYISQLAEAGKGSYRGLEDLERKWESKEYVNRFEREVQK